MSSHSFLQLIPKYMNILLTTLIELTVTFRIHHVHPGCVCRMAIFNVEGKIDCKQTIGKRSEEENNREHVINEGQVCNH